jgi:hypothetical protein
MACKIIPFPRAAANDNHPLAPPPAVFLAHFIAGRR